MHAPKYSEIENSQPEDRALWDTGDYLRHQSPIGLTDNVPPDDDEAASLEGLDGSVWLRGAIDHDEEPGFSQIIVMPGPLVTSEIADTWRRIYTNILLNAPPEHPWELVIRSVYHEVRARGFGSTVSPGALMIGSLLAIAKAQKFRIETHPRDLAKDLGVRYQTLLQIRRIAAGEVERHRVALGLTVD